ncbi:MAG TPA: winged helix DNA-binding domain-containing protein [Actinophytocola sp.]|uniref:winged helix DNA-binding domain-containing protein n=1 Tax=Actinophytocola sp. TaxID=1872138 RepID=UPI002DBAF35C|nr:winged helix DNA-binding domain-containing protein [Actinophytocola sp.]HEU5471493.1 winged helix DNA-binding domain-containing protein [Actinophytocola sp.]
MRRVTMAERRARLARRHLLAPGTRVDTPERVAHELVALHGTDPTTVYLSAWARMRAGDVPAVERALYHDRTLVRLLAMRRTVFVVPVELAPVVLAAASRAVAVQQRKLMLEMLAKSGMTGDLDGWLAEVELVALRALAVRGEATANELAGDDPRLATELVVARGKSYEGKQRVVSRVLLVLAAQGRIVRGRPLGSWTSTQFRWSPTDRWFPELSIELSTEDAAVELARRWLIAFGPATVDDLKWWTGWTVTQTRRALARLDTVEVDLDGRPGLLLAGDLEPEPEVEPWVALLPALDPTPMGWARRDFYLGPHAPLVFDGTGNVSPTVWVDGRIAGGWAQRKDGEVVFRLLEDVGSDAMTAIKQAAAELTTRLGPVRLTPRARRPSPIERELLE